MTDKQREIVYIWIGLCLVLLLAMGNLWGQSMSISTEPGCKAYAPNEQHLTNVPECKPQTAHEVVLKHANFVRKVQSCQRKHWPVNDAVCEGIALSLAGWVVDEHPELFGPDALKEQP